MATWDILLKSLLKRGCPEFFKLLGVDPTEGLLDTELTPLVVRRLDFIARTAESGLVHLEFQSTPDPVMTERMLEYRVDIGRRLVSKKKKPEPLSQYVVAVGAAKGSLGHVIRGHDLCFRYNLIDKDPADLKALLSGSIADRILYLTCVSQANINTWRKIRGEIYGLSDKSERLEYLAYLALAADLPHAPSELREEFKAMGITVDLQSSPIIRDVVEMYYLDRARKVVLGLCANLDLEATEPEMEAILSMNNDELDDTLIRLAAHRSISATLDEIVPDWRSKTGVQRGRDR